MIRLPRDWLGPRDELVPFGPSAEDADAPHDFWGEAPHWDFEPTPPPAPHPPALLARVSEHARVVLAAIVVAISLTVIGLKAGSAPHARQRTHPSATTYAAVPAAASLLSHPATKRALAAAHHMLAQHRTSVPRPTTRRTVHHARANPASSSFQVVHYTPPATTTPPTQSTPPPTSAAPSVSQVSAAPSSSNPPALGSGGGLAPGTSPDS